jgi:mannitol-1-phosphate/altronate dehydrogenase
MAPLFAAKWANANIDTFVDSILSDKSLWGTDIARLNGFAGAVKENLQLLEQQGAAVVIAGKQIKTVA